MQISKALTYFILGGILGHFWEKSIVGKTKVKSVALGNVPFLPVYGVGVVLIYIIGDIVDWLLPKDFNRIHKILIKSAISTLALTSIECISGVLSERYSGIKGWDYGDEEDCPESCTIGCKGYNSPLVTLIWPVVSLGFYLFAQ